MQLTTAEYHNARDLMLGYCPQCDQLTGEMSHEPDAEGYLCEHCDENTSMGIDNALVEEHLDITDD